jgi:hypothetical protein
MPVRFLGYAGDRMTNIRPAGLDRMTNIRLTRLISAPIRHIPALVNGQMRLFDKPPTRAPRKRSDTRAKDYPAGPYAWTEQQARSCVAAHAWAGPDHLHDALRKCWMDDRPPCWPPTSVLPAEEAVTFLLAEFARIHTGWKEA